MPRVKTLGIFFRVDLRLEPEDTRRFGAASPTSGPLVFTSAAKFLILRRHHLAKRPEPYAHLIHQQLRLFPRRKVPALVELVVMDEPGIGPLRPAPRRMVLLVGKDAHRNGDRDVLGSEVDLGEPIPIETRRRDCCVRQPEQRRVVEHIVPGKACRLFIEGACDETQTDRVVIDRGGGRPRARAAGRASVARAGSRPRRTAWCTRGVHPIRPIRAR